MKTLFSLTCALTILTCSQASANLIFDDFDSPVLPNGQFGGSTVAVSLGDFASSAQRTLTANNGFAGINNNFGNDFTGKLGFAGAGDFTVSWAIDSPPLVPAINPASGQISFLLTDVTFLGSMDLVLTLSDTDADSATVTKSISGVSGVDVEFLFSDFVTDNPAFDVTSLQTVTLSSPSVFGTFTAGALVVTPEPSGLILAGLGLASLCTASYVRRRKQPEVTTTAA